MLPFPDRRKGFRLFGPKDTIIRSVILDSSTNWTDGWRRNERPQRSTSRQELEDLGLRNFIETLLNVLPDQRGAGAAQRSLRRPRNSADFHKSF